MILRVSLLGRFAFAVAVIEAGDGLVGAGVKGTVQQIPAGWKQLFLLSAGSGILDGVLKCLQMSEMKV